MPSSFLHPGELFIDEYGFKQEPETVFKYAAFLRTEAGISDQPPIELATIYQRFKMLTPTLAPLKDQQALLVDAQLGLILIREDDPRVRRRFSEAHELMECLFQTLPARQGASGIGAGNFGHCTKERLCQQGAAELLMPRSSFAPLVNQLGVSFATAQNLAKLYDVSVTASLVQAARVARERFAVVLWRMKHKPTELQRLAEMHSQLPLFGEVTDYAPAPQLRVEWAIGGTEGDFIPKNKSVDDNTSIYAAWRDGIFTEGSDVLDLGKIRKRCHCENYPFDTNAERMVLSLLQISSRPIFGENVSILKSH